MASLRWTADGIEAAERAGGIVLETYRRPGYTGGLGVRPRPGPAGGEGIELELDVDPDPDEDG